MRTASETSLYTSADLILTPWVSEPKSPLEAFGPPRRATMVEHILAAYHEDIAIRVDGAEPANTTGYKVNDHEIAPGRGV